ncbi:MAG: UvrD-helicase domain-containing protein [Actinomycetota bacterium]
MTLADPLVDQQDRDVITGALDRTLFVEAGAGSGKTSSLVQRIVNLVQDDGVPVTRIAAITFTEAAARELRTRVRDALEERGAVAADGRAGSLEVAAGQVESAAFSTLHSFALRMLSDHPIEAGLPPGFGVVDEITSTLEFDESWRVFVGRVGDDMTLLELQERAEALKIDLRQFAGVARRFDDNWDLLELVTAEPPKLSEISFADALDGVDELRALADLCITPEDKYLQPYLAFVDQLDQARSAGPVEQLHLLRTLSFPPRNRGRSGSWRDPGLDHVRGEVEAVRDRLNAEVDRYRNEVMEHFITLVAGFVSARVEQRQLKGELAYHDLLVLARRLLRSDEVVRQTLHQRYSRILLDEFQDTDPIQIEIAVLLASAKPVGNTPWDQLAADLPPGRLVVVGDPKQSIYRFRRADIGVYTQTEEVLVDETSRLTTNFRSVPGVLDWVNRVFALAIGDGEPGKQPPYVPLDPARKPAPVDEPAVTVLGGPHDKSVRIHRIREAEGIDVAAITCRIMEEEWLVERDGGWLPARLKDIAVLIPSRLSLPSLESAFAATNVPFRPETNSLVYATQEVRDVLAGVRAVVNPTNSVDVVATLRSALFAIGDDELLDWKLLEGSWDYRDPLPLPDTGLRLVSEDGDLVGSPLDVEVANHPVAAAYAVLRAWHDDRWWHDPATFIDRIVRERRLREAALAEPRPRDRWRRYRFLSEQAREFTETQGGDLHDFVAWVEIQSSDMARVTEPVPAEPDDDAVRVLTIHGAKGLEFPIVVLAGAPTEESRGVSGPQVIFPPDGHPQVKLGGDRQTAEFDVHASMEEVLDSHERVRLHYVAATRARDHLIVSAHHKTGGRQSIGRRTWEASADCPDLWRHFEATGDEQYRTQPPTQLRLAGGGYREELAEWTAARNQIAATAEGARHWSATSLAEATRVATEDEPSFPMMAPIDVEELSGPADAPLDYQATIPGLVPPDSPTWRTEESSGAALGSAVHAALELVDFEDPGDLDALASSTAAANGVPDLVDEVRRRVEVALSAPTISMATVHDHWRELYVAMPTGSAGSGTVEGFIDLCIETEDGLLVVDYKTDGVASPADVAERVLNYRIQGATYAVALEHVTGMPVIACRFLFIGPDQVIEADVADLRAATDEVRQLLRLDGSP